MDILSGIDLVAGIPVAELPVVGAPLISSIQTALQEPIFPGKVIVWLLFMLSIVSWVMIISKSLHLAKQKRVDKDFGARLRESRTTLEVFEEGWDDGASLKHLIYVSGSREAAFHLLGSREPQDGMIRRLRRAPKLTARQLDFLNLAFRSGYRTAMLRLSSGIAGFRFVAVAALLFGTIGMVWTLMTAFDSAAEFAEFAPAVGAALGFLAIALLVASPAILARIAFDIHIRRRKVELTKFRDDIARLFERSYAATAGVGSTIRAESIRPESIHSEIHSEAKHQEETFRPEAQARHTDETVKADTASEESSTDDEPKKKFHSIRDRLLRGPDDVDDAEEQINPIAQQAATLRVR